jgi:putative flippase GtrA
MQFLKYIVVGAGVNLLCYGAYVALTFLKVGPIFAMSFVYTTACLVSFLGNKNWTFRNRSRTKRLLSRYFAIQIIGYLTNLAMLVILSRVLGFPHQTIQLLAIFVVGVELFVLSKYYVFWATQNAVRP